MKIVIHKENTRRASSDILKLSRTVRQLGNEVKEVERKLRGYSELSECVYELSRQKDKIETTTGKLVNLSNSLREITEAYTIAEERNEDRLEEAPAFRKGAEHGRVYVGSSVQSKVWSILR